MNCRSMNFPTLIRLCVFLSLFLAMGATSIAQTEYYVSVSHAALRALPESTGEKIVVLSKYDNVVSTGDLNLDWVAVKSTNYQGFVLRSQISEGKAIVTTYKQRSGAKCKDGTHSNATGRGACSHHGGVLRWLYNEKQQVRIKK